ncbi:MAG: hypothetical protein Q4G11_06810, partial [Gallicola sp.]|nr:hypothetical protein [Gallicola sp.]
MDYPIGIEMTEDYLSFETAKAALKLVKDVMLTQPGESVVITADTSTDTRVVKAVANAAYSIGAHPVIVKFESTGKAFEEPDKIVHAAVSETDVWIELSYFCTMHTPAFQKSIANGARYICLNGMDVTMITNTIGKINYDILIEFGEYLTAKVEKADEILITDDNGTHLHSFNRGRKVKHSGQLATKKGYPIMLGGQVSWCPIEETINGNLIFDAAVFPPAELGKLNELVKLTIEEGRIVNIEGGNEAEIFKNWLESFDDPNMFRLAHYSIGFNPGVTEATGRIVEDERIFG